MKKRLFVIDGHGLCYRAYYAFIKNPLINSNGQNTSAIYGFFRMLFRLIKEQSPDYLAVAFDPPVKSFRFRLYNEYKANRPKMPENMRSQIGEIKNVITAFGIPIVESSDHEADDVLGTIAEKFSSDEIEIYLVTSDKDAYQLVKGNVYIYSATKGISEYEIFDAEGVMKKTGLLPEKIVDYMSLMGDASDNVPGVKGIGEKTALRLISEYGSLEGVYENLDAIKGKTGDLLRNGKDMAILSRKLVTIVKDIDIPVKLNDFAFSGIDSSIASDYFAKAEMPTLITEFFQTSENTKKSSSDDNEKTYILIKNESELRNMISDIYSAGIVSFDTETDSVHPVEAELVGMSFSIRERSGWFLPLRTAGLFGENYLPPEVSLPIVTPLLEDTTIKKIGQNIKFDLLVLKTAGISLSGIYFDTMIASYLINPSERRHNLDDLAEKYLNYKTISYRELTGTGKNTIPLSEVPLDKLAEYAIEDADIAFRLFKYLEPILVKENLAELFNTIEMPLLPILAEMEYTGVKIDTIHFSDMRKDIIEMIAKTEKGIFDLAGQEFNINSTKELSVILFDRLKLRKVKKTKTGYSTDIQVLETLKGSHEIIDHLINYRTLAKLLSTYIDSLPALISRRTGRIHTSYNQTVTATGRLSSSDPNLQNIPVRDDYGRNIRKGFIPSDGFLMMSADYSQIELRLAAHFSEDTNMIAAFKNGIDIHNMTASSVFGVHIDSITSDMRRQAKIINFATIYGVSPYGLSQQAEIGIKEAAEFIERYFTTYPGFKKYIESTIEFAKKNGYVTTLLGRKRNIPDINSDTVFRREGAERIAINTPIQGTSADMIKIAMIDIAADITIKNMRSRMIMQVHDELVFEVHKDEINLLTSIVKDRMENAIQLKVPVDVDISTGKNWDEAH